MPTPPEKKRANVRDVARHANVSVATVSRVLNGATNVSPSKRAQVEQAIEALRFVPSSAARAINSGRTRLVGALVPTLDHAIFARFIDALETGLDGYGLSLIVARTSHSPQTELDRARKLLDIGAEALVVSGVTRAPEFSALAARYDIPIIATSYYAHTSTYPTIGYDNAAATRLALDHLKALGHRRIAVLTGPIAQNDRTQARLAELDSAEGVQTQLMEGALGFEAAAYMARAQLQSKFEPTAFLCLSDVLAQGVLIALKADGIQVPRDISVIGIDDLPNSQSFDPPLTSIHLPTVEMGRATASALADWIEAGTPPAPIRLETPLITRGSTAPPSLPDDAG